METKVLVDAVAVTREATKVIAAEERAAVAARGRVHQEHVRVLADCAAGSTL